MAFSPLPFSEIPTIEGRKTLFQKSQLGKKMLLSILFFSTIITLFLTSIQIYIDYKKGVNGIYTTVEQIKATQLESLAQNLWNINNEQIQIQLKGLLEIETIKGLRIIPLDDKPISIMKGNKTENDILNTYPIYYERKGQKNHLGNLEIISDLSPVIEELKSRIFIILMTQGTKTFIVSSFILLMFNLLVNKHLFKIKKFAEEIGLDNTGNRLQLSRAPTESKDELDDLVESLNIMQQKIIREANEKKNFQEQLLQSQKMEALGTLASGIAHDFNNILQGLYNALFILEEEVIDNADALQKLSTAGDLVDRARELVKQILIYTKQQEGNFNKFSAIAPIQDVVNILRAAKPKNVVIDLFIDPPNGKLYGDRTQLKQILLNLGNNAIHALEDNPNGQIKIKLTS
jgi:signal transduction histidine kinase